MKQTLININRKLQLLTRKPIFKNWFCTVSRDIPEHYPEGYKQGDTWIKIVLDKD